MTVNSNITIVSGHQPAYMPWLGYFHKLYLSDKFVYMDNVQFIERGWINRNRIKGSGGEILLTVPIDRNASLGRGIHEIMIKSDFDSKDYWQKKHWNFIFLNYKKSKFFNIYSNFLEDMYLNKRWSSLLDLCWYQFCFFKKELNLNDRTIIRMTDFSFNGSKDDLILDHCIKLNANVILFGKHGTEYVDENKFTSRGIKVVYQDYIHTEYNQMYGKFQPNISILDLLMNCGPEESLEILIKGNLSKNHINSL